MVKVIRLSVLIVLGLGALDYVPKPDSNHEITTSLEFRSEVIRKIKAVGGTIRRRRPIAARPSLARRPFSIVAPLIIVICAIGAFTVHNAMLDIWFMMLFGVIGYIFKKLDYPMAPMVLALVLGDRAEDSFRQSMLISQGNLSVFFSNGLVGSIMALGLVMLFWPVVNKLRGKA